MHWDLLLRGLFWVSLVLEGIRRVCSLRHTVYWNSSNQRFLRDDYAVRVDINDYLDIYCPHYESHISSERTESFTLYMVDREGYEGCYETPGAFKRWECNKPYAPFGPIRFSEKIQRFTPFSLGFEFQPGEDYYYISVPAIAGARDCLKLLVSVCCTPTTLNPGTVVPKSKPRGRGGGGGSIVGGKASGQEDASMPRESSTQCTGPPGWLHICSFSLLIILQH